MSNFREAYRQSRMAHIPAPDSVTARPTILGLLEEIRDLTESNEPQAWEVAAAKAREVACYCARVSSPVITRAEIDAENPLLRTLA